MNYEKLRAEAWIAFRTHNSQAKAEMMLKEFDEKFRPIIPPPAPPRRKHKPTYKHKWRNNWAKWWAIDYDGRIREYECKPEAAVYGWVDFSRGRAETVSWFDTVPKNWERLIGSR